MELGWKSPNPGPNTRTVFLAISQTSYQPPDSRHPLFQQQQKRSRHKRMLTSNALLRDVGNYKKNKPVIILTVIQDVRQWSWCLLFFCAFFCLYITAYFRRFWSMLSPLSLHLVCKYCKWQQILLIIQLWALMSLKQRRADTQPQSSFQNCVQSLHQRYLGLSRELFDEISLVLNCVKVCYAQLFRR